MRVRRAAMRRLRGWRTRDGNTFSKHGRDGAIDAGDGLVDGGSYSYYVRCQDHGERKPG